MTTKDFLFMGEAACRGPRERHSPGPNVALNGPGSHHEEIRELPGERDNARNMPGARKRGRPRTA